MTTDLFGRQGGTIDGDLIDLAAERCAPLHRRTDPQFVVVDDATSGGRSAHVPLAAGCLDVNVAANAVGLAEFVRERHMMPGAVVGDAGGRCPAMSVITNAALLTGLGFGVTEQKAQMHSTRLRSQSQGVVLV